MTKSPLFLPTVQCEITESLVLRWYNNLFVELEESRYEKPAVSLLSDHKNYYGCFLNERTRSYYQHHFIRFIAESLKFLFTDSRQPRILDIGCGCGMQSILMSILGAEVVAVDINPEAINVCKQRCEFYEDVVRKKIPITFIQGDILQQKRGDIGWFNGIYSLFAWEHVSPQSTIVEVASGLLKPFGRIALQNTNPSMWLKKLSGQNTGITKDTLIDLMTKSRINCVKTTGTVALPKQLWEISFLKRLIVPVDQVLSRINYLSISYVYMGIRDSYILENVE